MKKTCAEFWGTFVLVFCGCGAAVIGASQVGWLGIAFAFAIALMAMVYTIGHVSGCHINPAVTFAMLLRKDMDLKEAVGYWVAQILGASAASFLLFVVASGQPDYYMTRFATTGYADLSPGGYSFLSAFIVEVVATAILVYTILGATANKATAGFAGIAIGLVLVPLHFFAIPFTNASFNVARSFGPALVKGFMGQDWSAMSQMWFFIVATFVGAALAHSAHKCFCFGKCK